MKFCNTLSYGYYYFMIHIDYNLITFLMHGHIRLFLFYLGCNVLRLLIYFKIYFVFVDFNL